MPAFSRAPAHLAATTRIASLSAHLSSMQQPSRAAATAAAPSSASSSSSSKDQLPPISFDKSPIPPNPLGSRFVRTAGFICIGDEILSSKTRDTNSHYFSKFCFTLGIELKRIEVIADDTDEIVEAVRRMADNYDWVVTSGGIGPTHDDITYESIAKAFDAEPLVYHDETLRRMTELNKRRTDLPPQTEEMMTARKRMALFPSKNAEVIFPTANLWVPVVRMAGKVCILPGIPRLFEALLDGFTPYIPIDKDAPRPYRVLVRTLQPESSIAPFLTKLVERVKAEGIKIGSYPKIFPSSVEVSLIGTNLDALKKYADEVAKEVEGEVVASGKLGDE
ncbi:hypothetical protein OC842_003022 [Tilletia horrida]|uniref:MoaB/Mog domain-containing protein n=1 Tax=Tilletia horrida TaxID=155126 RepID=A0AAN6JL42_9BASI|nr:hypothetical protein OC842_003022 [Tilletia horrida]